MQFNGVSCNFYFTENIDIYFQTVTDEVFLAWCLWLDSDLKGTFHRSNQVEPINKNRIARDALYTLAEKKKIKPTAECTKMYAMSNKDCNSVLDILDNRALQRILQEVDVTAMSLYDSILYQVSHDRKYKSYELHRQIAYYMVRWPDICWPVVKDRMSPNDTYESFIKNIFYGFTYPPTYVVIAVISKMWNVSIDLITPRKGLVKCFHDNPKAHIVLVHNDQRELESLFTATKGSDPEWRPIKGVDWSNTIKSVSNVKVAANFAEKKYRACTARAIITDYNEVNDSLINMKKDLVGFHQEMKSIESKIQVWSKNVNLMESRQSRLRLKLTELGVNITSFSSQGTFVEGFQELISTPGLVATPTTYSGTPTTASLGAPPPVSSSGTPTTASLGAPTTDSSSSTTPTADFDNTSLGSPPAAFKSNKDNAVSTTAEVHVESSAATAEESSAATTEDLEVLKTVEGEETPRTESNFAVMQALGWPKKSTTASRVAAVGGATTVTGVTAVAGATTTTPTTSTAASFISSLPPLPLLPTAPNFNFPTVSAGTAATMSTPSQLPVQQSVVNVAGQNILVSGVGPIQVGGRSMRWGRMLKGQHNYFCSRCKCPFTQKADCTRHEETNCPMIPKEERKTFDCEICGVKKTSKQYLKEHMNEVHLKIFSYKCKVCGEGFYKHSKLVIHNKTCLAKIVVTTSAGLFGYDDEGNPTI